MTEQLPAPSTFVSPQKAYTGVVNGLVRGLFNLLCRVHGEDLAKVPDKGPLILVANHVNFLEVPVIRSNLYPRPVIGLSKEENWRNPLFRFLFNLWGGIPIQRDMVDRAAIQACLDALAQGCILAVAPEGTRSYTGQLQPGKPGIVALAARSQAPLLPLAYWGGEKFWEQLKRLRRTDFYLRVGRPFIVDTGGAPMSRDVRQAITDEIMYKLAELMPEEYRGHYSGVEGVQYRYLKDIPSN